MLLSNLRLPQDRLKEESKGYDDILSRLWACFGVVPKGEALSLVILLVVASSFSQIYDNQLTAISTLAIIVLIWKGRQWLRWPLLVFVGYLLLSALWHFGVDDGLSPKLQAVTAAVTGRQTLFVMLAGGATAAMRPSLSRLAPLFLLITTISTLFGMPLLANPSTNSALIVLCLPMCRKWWATILTMLVVISQSGATAYLMMTAILLMTISKYCSRKFLSLTVTTGLGLALLVWNVRPSFFIFYDRWDEYGLAARFWWENINIWVGAGLGTFQVLGPAMQKWDGRGVTEVWMSLHSDILQVVFELGLIGAALAAWLVFDSIRRAEYNLRLSLIVACLFGLFYFPMQIPLVAFFLILSVVQVQRRVN